MADRGRPLDYNPDLHIPLARALSRAGFVDWEISEEIGISERQFYRWKASYEDFRQAVEENKEAVDDRVEQALLKRSMGYTIELKKEIALSGPAGAGSELVEAVYDVHIPADPGSAMNWLSNRRGGKWRQKPEPSQEDSGGLKIILTNASDMDMSNCEIHIPVVPTKTPE